MASLAVMVRVPAMTASLAVRAAARRRAIPQSITARTRRLSGPDDFSNPTTHKMPRGYGRARTPPNVVPREIPPPRQPRREKKARGPLRKRKLGITSVYFVNTQLRHSYSLRRKARILSYMETPSVATG
jgi:hypothetical protein